MCVHAFANGMVQKGTELTRLLKARLNRVDIASCM